MKISKFWLDYIIFGAFIQFMDLSTPYYPPNRGIGYIFLYTLLTLAASEMICLSDLFLVCCGA